MSQQRDTEVRELTPQERELCAIEHEAAYLADLAAAFGVTGNYAVSNNLRGVAWRLSTAAGRIRADVDYDPNYTGSVYERTGDGRLVAKLVLRTPACDGE